MEIVQYYQTKNPCFTAGRKIKPSGIVVHSTGANNPNIKRYVGPNDGILGENRNGNHWNKPSATKCVHAWIGKVADGSIKVYQTLPWDHRCWGVGSGNKGSYNASHIQFEICEDGLKDETYYNEAFNLAKELCAYLCRQFDISTDNIVGHYEAYNAGYGSNHGDPQNWQKKFGGSMAQFRADVKTLLNGENSPSDTVITEGNEVVTETVKPTGTSQNMAVNGSGVVTMKTLRMNARGTQVKVLQWLLNLNGYDAGVIDGIFGKKTKAAVEAYQMTNGLEADGIVGKKTWTKILA